MKQCPLPHPPMKSFITIKEACLLTGKSEITIRRLIRHLLKHDQANAGPMIRHEKTPSGFVYTIDKELLAQKHLLLATQPPTQTLGHDQALAYADDTASEKSDQAEPPSSPEFQQQPPGQSPSQPTRQNPPSAYAGDQPLVKALVDTIDVLKDQLGAKDHQLAVKDEQISALIKDRERSDVLLKNLQDRIYLLPPPDPSDEAPARSRGERVPQETVVVSQDNVVVHAETTSSSTSPQVPPESDKPPAKPKAPRAGQGTRPSKASAKQGSEAAKPRPGPWWRPW